MQLTKATWRKGLGPAQILFIYLLNPALLCLSKAIVLYFRLHFTNFSSEPERVIKSWTNYWKLGHVVCSLQV